jgi:hypothetical protein
MFAGTILAFCIAIFAPAAAAVGQPMPSTLLVEHCREFAADPDSVNGRLCDSYVRGYLDGLVSAGWLTIATGETPPDNFTQRASRTRLGAPRSTAVPNACVPDRTSPQSLVAKLIAYADAQASVADVSSGQLIEGMLRSAYPCDRNRSRGES